MADTKWNKFVSFTKSGKQTMKVFIIILNYLRQKEIKLCLASLKRIKAKDYQWQTLIIDNSCKNTGFAAGNNIGIRQALSKGVDYILLLNNDTLVEPNFLDYLIKTAEREEKIGMVSPKIYFAQGFEYHKNRYTKKDLGKVIWYAGGKIDWQNILGIHEGLDEVDKGQFNQTKEVEFASGCCLLIKRKVFQNIKFLDERYFLYLEDMDFCVRVKNGGYKIIFEPKAIVWHKNLGTNKEKSKSLQAYYYTRNRLLFGSKYAPLKTKLALIKESLKFIYKGTFWQRKGVIDFYLGKFGKGSFHEE